MSPALKIISLRAITEKYTIQFLNWSAVNEASQKIYCGVCDRYVKAQQTHPHDPESLQSPALITPFSNHTAFRKCLALPRKRLCIGSTTNFLGA